MQKVVLDINHYTWNKYLFLQDFKYNQELKNKIKTTTLMKIYKKASLQSLKNQVQVTYSKTTLNITGPVE